ncbi:MAG: pantoate--beta-alanine ligase [Candidatus Omnitrophica bacterium]|nr:pantoate--beta-alanine ligase [Candidatus Omnitrophota bacterium]MCF7894337.1 pantoate--beta-alanine ligase [Candidatus Omnitrophota bacterium]
MITTKSIKKIRKSVSKARNNGKIIGFVPTMGALHKGHLSLINKAKKESDYLVVSIFINSLQFSPSEDFKSYPRKIKIDKRILEKKKVDLLFYPQADKMYGPDFSSFVEETRLSKKLCGKSRPGHFKGVTTIVAKLFNIVQPDLSFFGQKDYQQALIIKKMVKDLNFAIKIKTSPTIREKDKLALSSRNLYLNQKERKEAKAIYEALSQAKQMIKNNKRNPKKIIAEMRKIIEKRPRASIDYIEIRNANNLEKIKKIEGKVFIGVAAYFGKTRLIDNIIVNKN